MICVVRFVCVTAMAAAAVIWLLAERGTDSYENARLAFTIASAAVFFSAIPR